MNEPLEYVIVKDAPQQGPQSNDCGMFVCAFAKFVSHGVFDISNKLFGVFNHRFSNGALQRDYARWKQNDRAISESETTENITSKHGGFKRSNKAFLKVQEHDNTSQKIRLQ
ncbi:hypothetical protein P3S68_020085 [Capsicum galapagoense]